MHAKREVPRVLWLAAAAALAAGCGQPIGYGPGVTPAIRDELQRSTPRPVIDASKKHVTSVVEIDMPVSLEAYNRFADSVPLEKVLVGTKQIPRVVRTEPLKGVFGQPGSRRRVVLEDGNTALEEVIEKQPGSFRYVVWNFTSSAGRYIAYAEGHFVMSENAQGTHIRWSYAFRPRSGFDGLLITSFVHHEYHAFMERGMAATRELLLASQPPASVGTP
jgi:hypothetical protein